MSLSFKRKLQDVQLNVAYVLGGTLQAMALPTDLPITQVLVTIAGDPVGTTSGAGALQNPFAPALAGALGVYTITGSPMDGSDGLQMKNVPFSMAFMDSWFMNGIQPPNTDLSTTIHTTCSGTFPIHFMDERLDDGRMIFTALEAQRYGDNKNLQLSILTGQLQAAAGGNDSTGIVGGTYSGVGVGTLAITVTAEQIVPLNFQWPAWNGASPFPMMDRDFEYLLQSGIQQYNSNNITLNRRRIQANTWFFSSQQATTTLAETGSNNLGVTPIPELAQKLGANIVDLIAPSQFQADSQLKTLFATQTMPAGVYFWNDWQNNLANAISLLKASGTHAWDTNLGALTTGAQQALRLFHVTYNPSAALQKLNPML